MTGKQFAGLLSVCWLIWLGSPWACADETPPTAQPAETVPAAADVAATQPAAAPAVQPGAGSPVNLAILLDKHMAIVRLDVRRGGVPFFEVWREFIEGKFNAADMDKNGVLDAQELTAVKPLLPTPANGNDAKFNRFNQRRGNDNTQQIVADGLGDEAASQIGPGVTCEQFVESLRTTSQGPVQIRGVFQASPASRALFARLDADHDEKLSISECERAFDALRPLDLVESDLIAPFQLTGTNPGGNVGFRVLDQSGQAGQRSARLRLAVKLLGFSNAASSVAWADRIRQHFVPAEPKTKVAKNLRREFLLFDEATFATMDADGDGTFDQEELAHFSRQTTANLELSADLARLGSIEAIAVRLDPAYRFEPAGGSNPSSQPAKLVTGVEELTIAIAGMGNPNARGQGPDFVGFLKQFDRDNNDYLEERELRQFNALNLMALDTNGDGKLYFDEITVYLDAQADAAPFRLLVRLTDHDHALFGALDTNSDGQLGRRELRQLTARLTAWDRNGDGQLSFDEVPRLYSIQISPDEPKIPANPFGFGENGFRNNENRRMPSPARATWFTQMDRNADGDVSRREFLGTAAQFRQLDADGDQLIDGEEAGRAASTVPPAAATAPAAAPAADDAAES